MKNNKKIILFVDSTQGFGGAGMSLYYTVKNLDKKRFRAIVLPAEMGPMIKKIKTLDCKVLDEKLNFLKWWIWHPFEHVEFPTSMLWFWNIINKIGTVIKLLILSMVVVFDYIKIIRICLKYRVDIVDLNVYHEIYHPFVLLFKFFKIPIVCHIRGRINLTTAEKWFCKYYDHFVFVSSFTLDSMFASNKSDYNYSIVYDSVDVEHFNKESKSNPDGLREKYGIKESEKIICMLSTLTKGKGHRCFLDAASIVKKKYTNTKFVIIGENVKYAEDVKSEIIKYYQDLDLEGNIIMYGRCDNVAQILGQVDISVQASELPEAFGRVPIETMACSKPIISTNVGATSELIEDRLNGLLVSEGDCNALAEAICELLKDSVLTKNISKSGYEIAYEKFDAAKNTRILENIFDRILQ